MISEEDKETLESLARSLPINPPLANNPEGDTSVKEMCVDLTEEELQFVWEEYKRIGGRMRKE